MRRLPKTAPLVFVEAETAARGIRMWKTDPECGVEFIYGERVGLIEWRFGDLEIRYGGGSDMYKPVAKHPVTLVYANAFVVGVRLCILHGMYGGGRSNPANPGPQQVHFDKPWEG